MCISSAGCGTSVNTFCGFRIRALYLCVCGCDVCSIYTFGHLEASENHVKGRLHNQASGREEIGLTWKVCVCFVRRGTVNCSSSVCDAEFVPLENEWHYLEMSVRAPATNVSYQLKIVYQSESRD
jgi:hypothetical protein